MIYINFYIVCGVQGSGKTEWVKNHLAGFGEPCIVFDAAFARSIDRAGAVTQGKGYALKAIEVDGVASPPATLKITEEHARRFHSTDQAAVVLILGTVAQ